MSSLKRHFVSPGKVILFGEWAVMDGHVGIASAIEGEFKCQWSASAVAKEDPSYIFRSTEGMALWDPLVPLASQQHIPSFFQKTVGFFETLLTAKNKATGTDHGGEFLFDRSWPLDWGLGSSSALLSCYMELLFPHLKLVERWNIGRKVLHKHSSPRASGLDLAAQLKGGTVYLRNHQPMGTSLDFPKELVFLHAGNKADTSEWIESKSPTAQQLQKIGKSADEFLKTKDWTRAIEEHSKVQSEMDIWPDELRKLHHEWMSRPEIHGMKSCGSGGGDCWMLMVESSAQESLRSEAQELGYSLKTHKISDLGVREVDSNNNEEKNERNGHSTP